MNIHTCTLPPNFTSEATRGMFDRRELWQPGQTITIGILPSPYATPALRKRIIAAAAEWTRYANLRFQWVSTPRRADQLTSNIQISLARGGSWSYIGKQATRIANGQPTMQFGWLDDSTSDDEVNRVVIHEFGHALGLLHEHQNPNGGIPWNRPVAYQFYRKTNQWGEAEVNTNIFATYENEIRSGGVIATPFDHHSIMLYPIPAELTLNGYSTAWNNAISEGDKRLIAQFYPK